MAINNYWGTVDKTPGWAKALQGAKTELDNQKAQKLAMALEMIKSGSYQPTAPGAAGTPGGIYPTTGKPIPPPSLFQRIGQGLTGPTLGGQNMNVGGQNFSFNGPQQQTAALQQQMDAYRKAGLIAPAPSATPTAGQGNTSAVPSLGDTGNYPFQVTPKMEDGKLSMGMTAVDPLKQLTAQRDQLEIAKMQRDEKVRQDTDRQNNELNTLTPEAARAKLEKENPSEAKFLQDAARGQQSFKGRNNAQITSLKEKAGYLYGLNQQDIDARGDVYKDFHSGKASVTVRSLNTAINHLFELNTAINNLGNSNIKPWNYVVQAGKESFGGLPAKIDYDKASNALSGELSNIYKPSGATDNEIAGQLKTMKPYSASVDQKQGVRSDVGLMLGRIDAMRQYHYETFNKDFDKPIELINPQTRQRIKRMGMQDLLDQYDEGDPYKQNLDGRQEPQEGQEQPTGQPQKYGKYTFTVK